MSEPAAKPSPEPAIHWRISDGPVDYADAVARMEARVAAIRAGTEPELVWLLEHPPLYTAGTSARDADLVAPGRLPVHRTGRGGQYTYHGPGQRVAYVMIDLNRRGRDLLLTELVDLLLQFVDLRLQFFGGLRRRRCGQHRGAHQRGCADRRDTAA